MDSDTENFIINIHYLSTSLNMSMIGLGKSSNEELGLDSLENNLVPAIVNAGEIFPKFAGLKFPLFRQKNILIEADGSDLHAVLHSVRIRLQAYNMAVV